MPSDASSADHVFDYIIAGGGSAGCVLANRLSADPACKVLLIEAGIDLPPGREPAEILHPAPIVIFHGTKYLWPDLRVRPFAHRRKTRFYEQARVIGGGSSVNAQVGNRGIPDDYDEWQRLGAEGWDWASVLPYFRKLEADHDYPDDPLHGRDGPIPIHRILRPAWPPFSTALASASEAHGLSDIVDQNAAFGDGYFAPAYTNRDSQRVTAAMAYLTPQVRARTNLTILTEALVTALHLREGRAEGVDVETAAGVQRYAGREVILSLGALHSPAVLMRAGIGPADVLKAHDIPVVRELDGVGRNLSDHPGTHLCAYVKPGARMSKTLRKSGHVAIRYSSGLDDAPSSDLYMHSGVSSAWHGVGRRIGYFYIWLNKSKSRGRVTLQNRDPHARPHVQMNLLHDDRDVKALAQAFRSMAAIIRDDAMKDAIEFPFAVRFSPFIRLMTQVRPLNKWIMGALGRLLDGPRFLRKLVIRHVLTNAPALDDLVAAPDKLEDYLRQNATSVSHVSCTCRMGRADDPAAVVDAAGRVHGVKGLRVVDASIMPSIPRANLNLATMMIAEKIADAIVAERAA